MKKGDKIVFSIIISLIVISFLVVFIYKNLPSYTSKIAVIKQNGKIIKTINLSSVKEKETFQIKTKDGHFNDIIIDKNKIGILDADCPDRVCIKTGFIDKPGDTIVCLPNKLIIAIEGEHKSSKNNIDGTTY